jgi:hypothetical protein
MTFIVYFDVGIEVKVDYNQNEFGKKPLNGIFL